MHANCDVNVFHCPKLFVLLANIAAIPVILLAFVRIWCSQAKSFAMHDNVQPAVKYSARLTVLWGLPSVLPQGDDVQDTLRLRGRFR